MSSDAIEVRNGAITLQSLNSATFPHGTPIELRITYPNIKHPIYGEGSKLEGNVKFMLPFGSFPTPNYYAMSKSAQEATLDDYVERLRTLYVDPSDIVIRKKLQDWLITATLLLPREDATSQRFKWFADFLAIMIHLDDIIDDGGSLSKVDVDTSTLYTQSPTWNEIISGDFEKLKTIGHHFPMMLEGLSLLERRYVEMNACIKNFRRKTSFLQRSFFASVESIPLLPTELLGERPLFSEEALKRVREHNVGFTQLVEFLALAFDLQLSQDVRSSLLFQIFASAYGLCAGLFNDIFGLNRDIEKGTSYDTSILRRVVREGLSLQTSFQKAIRLLQNATRDTQVAAERLMQTFPEDMSLVKYIQIVMNAFDGQIYAYNLLFQINGRYGTIKTEIVSIS